MGINGVNNYYAAFGNYRMPSIPAVSVEDVQKQDELNAKGINENVSSVSSASYSPVASASSVTGSSLQDISLPSVKRSNADLEDISLTFNKGDDYGYIGKDSDIYSLDIENAISDMQKDDVLKQYQYFVGGSSSFGNPEDGVVVPKF